MRLIGSEVPRIHTPPLRELTPETTLGFDVITFAEDVLEIRLNPWQKWLLIHALEIHPNGWLRFRTVVVLVGRQNGKSTVSQVLALYWLYVTGAPVVLGTAQDLDTAEEVWDGTWDLIEETPELRELADEPIRTNGKKAIRLKTGERYKIKAANRKAGRGLSGDRIILDELREHQSWDAWAAITKTTMAREHAQIWCFSNAGDSTSVVLRHLRLKAHEALGDPDGVCAAEQADELLPDGDELRKLAHDNDLDELEVDDLDIEVDDLGLFEWSAAPGRPVTDRQGWADANPSIGWTMAARTVASAVRTDPPHVIRTEVLCQWVEGGPATPFPAGSWEATTVELVAGQVPQEHRIDLTQPTAFGLAVSWKRSATFVMVAGHRADGTPQVERAAGSYGTDWAVDWFCDPEHPDRAIREIAIQKGSPAWSLKPDLEAAGLTVVEWGGEHLGIGTGRFWDEIGNHALWHVPYRPLDRAAGGAAIKALTGGAFVIDLKGSPVDAAPLLAAVAAFWLLRSPTPDPVTPPKSFGITQDRQERHETDPMTVSF